MEDFLKYCRGVAGVPGNLSLRIFGCKDENLIEELSTSLGNALQITNILRDVKEDARMDRLYIPREYLNNADISSTNPNEVIIDKNLAVAREELAQRAEDDYRKAYQIIPLLDKDTARPVKAIASIYRKYFDIMQKRGWEVISPKPQISKFSKLSLALRAYFGK